MVLEYAMPAGIDIKLTEHYLLGMSDVLDASVWWSHGALNAHVTVVDDSGLDSHDIQAACMNDLGLHQTPRALKLIVRKTLAA